MIAAGRVPALPSRFGFVKAIQSVRFVHLIGIFDEIWWNLVTIQWLVLLGGVFVNL